MPASAKRHVETSLIEQFLYPKYGPGQLWEEVARRVQDLGAEILTGWDVVALEHESGRIAKLTARNTASGEERTFFG